MFKTLSAETAVTETVQQGIFLIPETPTIGAAISLADSAAMSLDSLLSQNAIRHELFVSEVDESVCGGCGTCIKTCIFHAAEIDPGPETFLHEHQALRGMRQLRVRLSHRGPGPDQRQHELLSVGDQDPLHL